MSRVIFKLMKYFAVSYFFKIQNRSFMLHSYILKYDNNPHKIIIILLRGNKKKSFCD